MFTCVFFLFNDTQPTDIYTLSLHDALPISRSTPRYSSTRRSPATPQATSTSASSSPVPTRPVSAAAASCASAPMARSEEHTSELQSRLHLVCRLLLEKKNKNIA